MLQEPYAQIRHQALYLFTSSNILALIKVHIEFILEQGTQILNVTLDSLSF